MATNTLGNYDETFFAQEALIQLEKVLGFAGRIYRNYNVNPAVRGDTIQVRRPASFTAADAPAAAMDLTTESVAVLVDKWKEVKFALTDKDLSLTNERIISDHIRPAAYALADQIDQDGVALYKDIPWYTTLTATPALADVATARKVMFDNRVPLKDSSMLHGMIGGTTEVAFLSAMAAAGMDASQQGALREASMGRLFGFDIFANQNTPLHTSGVSADFTGTVDGVNAIGATAIAVSALTVGGTMLIGDTFSIAGNTQRYVVTVNKTVDGAGQIAALTFAPALKVATAGTEVITFHLGGAAKAQNLFWHRNAFCLASAPLSTLGSQLGARIAVVNDPITGISLRSRMFYVGNSSEVNVALDVLYGFKTLDCNLAARAYQA